MKIIIEFDFTGSIYCTPFLAIDTEKGDKAFHIGLFHLFITVTIEKKCC